MSSSSNTHLLPPEVLHIRLDLEQGGIEGAESTSQEQDGVFDTLVTWCDAQQLFIGGSLSNAVVYAPFKPLSTQKRHRLRQLILAQPGISGCKMQLRMLSSLHSLTERAACLEAFSQAQRFLAERMVDCADALAALVPIGPKSWRASVRHDGAMLVLQHWQLQIWVAISRHEVPLGSQPVPEFAAFDKRTIDLNDIHMFVPDWLDLHWTKVEPYLGADLSEGRWEAHHHRWQIWVTGNPSAQLTHREVMLRWMGVLGVD